MCARHCSQLVGNISNENKYSCPAGAYIQVGRQIKKISDMK